MVILQEHEGFRSQLARHRTMLVGEDIALPALGIQIAVGVVEKSQLIFRLQDTAAGQVDIRYRDGTILQRLRQRADKPVGAHVHIRTCLEGLGRVLLQAAQAVVRHLTNRTIVGHHETTKLPLVAQHVGKQPSVGRGMLAIHEIERRHKRACTSLSRCPVGREVLVVHAQMAHIHRVIVTASLHCPIEPIVLHAGHYLIRIILTSLIAPDVCLGNLCTKEGVFSPTLCHTAPTGIQCDIHHG